MAIKWGTTENTNPELVTYDSSSVKVIKSDTTVAWSQPLTIEVEGDNLGAVGAAASLTAGTNSEPSPASAAGNRGSCFDVYSATTIQGYFGDTLSVIAITHDAAGYTYGATTIEAYCAYSREGSYRFVGNLTKSASPPPASAIYKLEQYPTSVYNKVVVHVKRDWYINTNRYYISTNYSTCEGRVSLKDGSEIFVGGINGHADTSPSGTAFGYFSGFVHFYVRQANEPIHSGANLGGGKYLGIFDGYRWWQYGAISTSRDSDYTWPQINVQYYRPSTKYIISPPFGIPQNLQTFTVEFARISLPDSQPAMWWITSDSYVSTNYGKMYIDQEWFCLNNETFRISFNSGTVILDITIDRNPDFNSNKYVYTANVTKLVGSDPNVYLTSSSTSYSKIFIYSMFI